ncbi:MAG TPA: aldo/keto reductase [Trebonia sp.]|nr:aldo/keto reductase [Trebonia sp.]
MACETGGAAAAGTWTLGDLRVNRIGFGAMRLPQRGAAFAPGALPGDRDQAITVLRTAVELGVNHIDTAGFYFSSLRSANELINTALAPYPDDLVIATKVGPRRDLAGAGHPGPAARAGRGEPATTSPPERCDSRRATWPGSTRFTRTSSRPASCHSRPAC